MNGVLLLASLGQNFLFISNRELKSPAMKFCYKLVDQWTERMTTDSVHWRTFMHAQDLLQDGLFNLNDDMHK